MDNKLTEFDISTSNSNIKGKLDGNKWIVDNDNSTLEILIADGKIEIEDYNKDLLLEKLVIEYKDGYKISFTSLEMELEIIATRENNIFDANVKFKLGEVDGDINLKTTKEGASKQNIVVTGNIKTADDATKIDINVDYIVGDNLIEKIDTNNIKKIEDLTSNEQNELLNNINILFNRLGLFDSESPEM